MNTIGLKTEQSEQLANQLNDLLANYQLFYMNVRGFHWNIKGANFFELHIKFEELYTNLQLKIDELAERVLTLGNTPMHSYTEYLAVSEIKAATGITNGKECIQSILNSFKTVISKERKILANSASVQDEGTQALMSDYIREQEKLVWMYTAYLG